MVQFQTLYDVWLRAASHTQMPPSRTPCFEALFLTLFHTLFHFLVSHPDSSPEMYAVIVGLVKAFSISADTSVLTLVLHLIQSIQTLLHPQCYHR